MHPESEGEMATAEREIVTIVYQKHPHWNQTYQRTEHSLRETPEADDLRQLAGFREAILLERRAWETPE
jgi:hypothetical protein